jgi:hypothetical protein
MIRTGTMKRAFLNTRAQSRLSTDDSVMSDDSESDE